MAERGGVVVVRPHEELREDMAPRLRLELLRAAADDPPMVVCDLRGGVRDDDALAVLPEVARTLRRWPACPFVVLADAETRARLVAADGGGDLTVVADLDAAPRPARLPAQDRAAIRLQPTLHAPGVARRWLTAILQGWGRLDEVAVAALVLDELVTNGVVHAGTEVDIAVTRRPDRLELTVSDRSRDPLVRRTPAEGDERGHGLVLVDALCTRWGVLPRHPEGKVVWLVLDR